MEILISLLILAVILVAAWYISTLLPQPIQKVAQVIIIVAALIWLIANIRPMIHAIAGT